MFKLILSLSLLILFTYYPNIVSAQAVTCDFVRNLSISPPQGPVGTSFSFSGMIRNCTTTPKPGGLTLVLQNSNAPAKTDQRIPITEVKPDGSFSVSGVISAAGTWEVTLIYETGVPIPQDRVVTIRVSSSGSSGTSPGIPTSSSSNFTDFRDLLNNNYLSRLLRGQGLNSLGDVVSQFLNIAFIIATFLSLVMLVWGGMKYIFSGGDKEGLSWARKRITWAIVGLIIVAIAYILAQFVEQILAPRKSSPISLITTAHAAPADLSTVYDFGKYNSLGQAISQLLPTIFSVAAVGVIFFFLIGAVKILVSGGNKDSVASGRNMITHSVIGFIILMMVFLIIQFVPQFIGIKFDLFTP